MIPLCAGGRRRYGNVVEGSKGSEVSGSCFGRDRRQALALERCRHFPVVPRRVYCGWILAGNHLEGSVWRERILRQDIDVVPGFCSSYNSRSGGAFARRLWLALGQVEVADLGGGFVGFFLWGFFFPFFG